MFKSIIIIITIIIIYWRYIEEIPQGIDWEAEVHCLKWSRNYLLNFKGLFHESVEMLKLPSV